MFYQLFSEAHIFIFGHASVWSQLCDQLQKLQRQPTPQEIAKHLRQPFSRVVLCMRKTQRPINMDAQPTDNERDSMVDLLASSIDDDKGATSLNSVMHS